ncbi:MAG TPA: patatin-like phospholipase family protein [Candidatus Eremiobacteraceae bacterium]|nr:patatin-like phospholipase family protein [Candidatus Eremiobacteraceae bacterium]
MKLSRSGFLAALGAAGATAGAARAEAALPPWYPLPPPLKPKLPTRALVLSGAGARGAYEAGALKWLYKDIDTQGIPYDVICGTSAGAINSAFAARATAESISQAEQLWLSMPQANVLQLVPPAQHAMDAGEAFRESSEHGFPAKLKYLSRANRELKAMGSKEDLAKVMGVVSSDGINGLVKKYPFTLTEMKTGLVITATNMTRFSSDAFYHFVGPKADAQTQHFNARLKVSAEGSDDTVAQPSNRRFRLTQDNLVKAVLASAAVPGVFQPVEVPVTETGAADLYVDGGVANNTPVSTAAIAGATDITVLIASSPDEGREKQPTTMPGLLEASFAVIQRELLEDDLRLALAKNLLSRYRDYRGLSAQTVAFLDSIRATDWEPIKLRIIRPATVMKLTAMGFNDAADLQAAFDLGYNDAQNPTVYSL